MIMGRERPRGFSGKKALNRQIFIVGYLQFVTRKHLHTERVKLGTNLNQCQGNGTGGFP
jgi:hypothetical protein